MSTSWLDTTRDPYYQQEPLQKERLGSKDLMPAQSSDTQMEQQSSSVIEPEGPGEAARPLARPDGGHKTGATEATRRDRAGPLRRRMATLRANA